MNSDAYVRGYEAIFGAQKETIFDELGRRRMGSKPQSQSGVPSPAAVELPSAPIVRAQDFDWSKLRALSIRQPFVELIMASRKDCEYRTISTRIRGDIAMYASLTYTEDEVLEAEAEGLDFHSLSRGVLVGVVDLWDSAGGDWYLRNPRRFARAVKSAKKPQPVWFWPF